MATNIPMPTKKSVKELLSALYDGPVEVEDAECPAVDDSFVSSYLCDDDKVVSLLLADFSVVGHTGGALMMIPAGGIEDAIADKEITKNMREGFYEVANILSRAMITSESPHIRLDKLYAPDESAETVSAMCEPYEVIAFSVVIPGGGSGVMGFWVS